MGRAFREAHAGFAVPGGRDPKDPYRDWLAVWNLLPMASIQNIWL
jgi:hypothetical protein